VFTVFTVSARDPYTPLNTNPNQLLLYKLYFTMSISNWLVFGVLCCIVFARTDNTPTDTTYINRISRILVYRCWAVSG